ncbi:MAG TPA: hypothetical protein VLF91_04380 [Candidatus Saccharimonadales bacterium]|nr:hypothetical protein [Candidatus Saccharimonadales bacterium]
MQKKTLWIVLAVVVVVAAAAAYLVMHKSSSSNGYGTTANSSTSKTSNTTASGAIINTVSSASLGNYLTSATGAPLYTYGGDKSGVSNCTGSCLYSWPAYEETSSSASLPTNVSTIKRSDDGNMQYTYKGMPLYTFTSDSGSTPTGNGVSDFQLARP